MSRQSPAGGWFSGRAPVSSFTYCSRSLNNRLLVEWNSGPAEGFPIPRPAPVSPAPKHQFACATAVCTRHPMRTLEGSPILPYSKSPSTRGAADLPGELEELLLAVGVDPPIHRRALVAISVVALS